MIPTTFGQLGALFDGPHATPTRRDDGPYFLNISSLVGGRLDLSASDHVNEEDFAKWTRRVTPEPGDLLFSYETRLGEAAMMPEGVRGCLGRRMGLLRPRRDVVDPRFLLYFYLSPQFQETIRHRSIHGATVERILLSNMADWPVDLPPLATQQTIAEVLGALDDKIASNSTVAQASEALFSAHFSALQADRDGHSVRVDELVELNPQCPPPTSAEAAYLDMQKLPTTGSQIFDWARREPKGGARFMNGDTVLARITPCLENRKTGFVDFLQPGETAVGSTEFVVLRSRAGLAKPLSFLIAIDDGFRAHAIQHMVGTSGRQRVAASDLATYEFCLPHDREPLVRLGELAAASFELLASQRNESRQLATLRDTLLPHLMSGRITVRDAEKAVEEVL